MKNVNRERSWVTNGNRKLTVPFAGLFPLLVEGRETLVLLPDDFLLQMRWCQKASKEKKLTSGCRSWPTDVCA